MLTNLLDGWFKIDLGEGAFYSVFGFVFVFVGIVILILIFTLLGLFMKRMNARKKVEKQPKAEVRETPVESAPAAEIPPEVAAVIAAAVAAYCEAERAKCDFVVKRIKRL